MSVTEGFEKGGLQISPGQGEVCAKTSGSLIRPLEQRELPDYCET